MREYQKYKQSKVPWIGIIPLNWQVSKLKYVTEVVTGNTPLTSNNKNYTEDENGYIWVKPSFLNEYTPVHNSAQRLTEIGKANVRIVPKESVMICCIGNTLGRFGITGKEMCTNQQINTLIPDNESIISGYLKFFAGHISSELIKFSNFVTLPMLTKSGLEDLHTILPPLPEQKAIATYLDEKTNLIDALIEKTEKKIELLKEQRTAIINQAVTKGLDTKAKMKDSGVEWIGKIPEGWVTSSIKFVSNVKGRIGFRGYTTEDLVSKDEGALILGATHLTSSGNINLENPVYISWLKFDESPEIKLSKGDILLVQRGSTCGKTAIIENDIGAATINPSLVVLKDISISSKYLFYIIKVGLNELKNLTNNVAIPMLSQEQIGNLKIVLPPKDEQQLIVNRLAMEIKKNDLLESIFSRKVEYLKEYRQALISEVVTGKICVLDEIPEA